MARRADEQRKHPRVEARLAMQLAEESLGDALVTTESLNISRGGVYCESAEFLSPLSRVALTVVLPPFGTAGRSRVLRSEGVVVRCEALPPIRGRKRWQLACCFTGLDADMRGLLDSFVAWRAQRGRRAIAARGVRSAAGAGARKARTSRRPTAASTVAKAARKATARKRVTAAAAKKVVKATAARRTVARATAAKPRGRSRPK
jgi:PilZ domain-containing protein